MTHQIRHTITAVILFAMATGVSGQAQDSPYQFNADSKDATQYTAEANRAVLAELDFENKAAFKDADRGFIAPLLNEGKVGQTDISSMQFMQDADAPATVNPSLWRHAQLVNRGGLYEVLPDRIYQVRGQDIANLTIIETENGVVLYDVCFSPLALEAAWKLYAKHRGDRDLKGIVISHSHTDHYGGIPGVVKLGLATPAQFQSGEIPIVVPAGFVDESVGENVLFGNIMSRRAAYQYGFTLPRGARGVVTNALGPITVGGANGLPTSVMEIKENSETREIDGVTFEFVLTPHTEAPAEMVFRIPEWKAISMAELVNHLQHNVYSMRGAKTRDPGAWGKYIHDAVVRWSDTEVIFGPHTWPVWGNQEVMAYLKTQRDIYKGMADQTTRLANYGYRPRDIVRQIELPDEVMKQWDARDYYGFFENNVIASYVGKLGWFDANPVELARHTDAESGKRYVEVMGGEEAVIEKALDFYQKGDYGFTVELLNKIVSYKAVNDRANFLMADAFEQLGYQQESMAARNWFLTAANELRSDDLLPQAVNTAGPDVLKAIPAELMMDVFATRIVPARSHDAGRIAFVMTLNDTAYGVEVENGVLNSFPDHTPADSMGTVTADNVTIFQILAGSKTLESAITDGSIEVSDGNFFGNFLSLIDRDIPNSFNLIQPRIESK